MSTGDASPNSNRIGLTEDGAIKRFCAADSKGLLFAYGILRGGEYFHANIDGKLTVPFWSKRGDAERILATNEDMSGCEVADLDVIFIVATQFDEIKNRGQYVGINWPDDREKWWGLPVIEVETLIRKVLNWPK